MSDGNTTGYSPASAHTCRTKEIISTLCGDTFASIALRLPWTVHQKNLSLHMRPPDANISLVELLVSEEHGDSRTEKFLSFGGWMVIFSRNMQSGSFI